MLRLRQFFEMLYLAFVIYIFYPFVYLNAFSEGKNLRPIIGIISQKVTTKFTPNISNSDTYIAASYVKQIEMAGAQVVPILPSYSLSKKKKLIRSVNGVLFPGGAAPVNDSGYFKTAKLVYEEAKKLNDKGNYYPIWGTCLGFETLQLLAAESDIRSAFDSENYLVPLNLTKDAIRSRLFKRIEKYLLESLMFEKVAFNMHSLGVGVDKYRTNSKLRAVFRVLSTNVDRKGKEFVSTIEGIKYPFYATQWHPEKNIFEWTRKESINHSPNAIAIAQFMSTFFVNEARKNRFKFPSETEELANIMFRFSPVYSGGRSLFEQVYVFGNKTERLVD